MPLDFIYEKNANEYRFDIYDTDEKLLEKVQTGRGDSAIYEGDQRFIDIESVFAGIVPSPVY